VEIPYIRDLLGDSPLHLCVKANNFQATAAFLEAIKDDPLDTHSRVIVDLFPIFIDRKIPAFNSYLQSRELQTQYLKRINRGNLKDYSLCERAVANAE
jgi:ankyrin repeat protein